MLNFTPTIGQQRPTYSFYRDLVDDLNDQELSKRFYYYLGLLDGAVALGDRPYMDLSEQVRDELMSLYTDLVDLEQETSLAGTYA